MGPCTLNVTSSLSFRGSDRHPSGIATLRCLPPALSREALTTFEVGLVLALPFGYHFLRDVQIEGARHTKRPGCQGRKDPFH
eukprot:scaffold2737_cov229-Pinguiococcus_pyrenoidosus.AAC.6